MHSRTDIDDRCISALRFLSIDAIERAKSGHPGLPLGAAPMLYALWSRHLRFDPQHPDWPDRDRFVLSAGHGSALLYAALHLFGYDLSLADLQAFRQWGSRTPGHPERGLTPGVEVTTGPLGQGLANAVGMAIAERHLAATFNRPGCEVVGHRTFVLAGDGDLMEGISYEACALAGHLRLGRLVVLYDANDVCLAGSTSLSTSEDVELRFASAGWHVLTVRDGNDLEELDAAIGAAVDETSRPSLLIVKTVIGYGAPSKQNTFEAHGAPLGPSEVRAAKQALGWPQEPPFLVPEDVAAACLEAAARGAAARAKWVAAYAVYRAQFADLAAEFDRRHLGRLPDDWTDDLPVFPEDPTGMATRKASEAALQALAARIPELVGGAADLNPSTLTALRGAGDLQAPETSPEGVQGRVGASWGYAGRNLHFGVREHAMAAIANGLAAHGGLIPYVATFLVFSDYLRPALRIAALSGCRTVFVFTHDSIGVGEDGPTHQPVEHLMSLRLIPNLVVLRPGDANETVAAWRIALERTDGPTALVLSRQALPTFDRSLVESADEVRRGGYVLWSSSADPEILLIATGSEVSLALAAARRLCEEGHAARVVSMPSIELFQRQPAAYRETVLSSQVRARLVVEAGRTSGWGEMLAGGMALGVDRFGACGPGGEVLEHFGFSTEAVLAAARSLLASKDTT
ncbi:MAG: transketolase [Candidatus Bipolaricaulota bacterium]